MNEYMLDDKLKGIIAESSQSSSVKDRSTPAVGNLSRSSSIIQRAQALPASITHSDIELLQRSIGNRAVCQLLSRSMDGQARQLEQKPILPCSADVIQRNTYAATHYTPPAAFAFGYNFMTNHLVGSDAGINLVTASARHRARGLDEEVNTIVYMTPDQARQEIYDVLERLSGDGSDIGTYTFTTTNEYHFFTTYVSGDSQGLFVSRTNTHTGNSRLRLGIGYNSAYGNFKIIHMDSVRP